MEDSRIGKSNDRSKPYAPKNAHKRGGMRGKGEVVWDKDAEEGRQAGAAPLVPRSVDLSEAKVIRAKINKKAFEQFYKLDTENLERQRFIPTKSRQPFSSRAEVLFKRLEDGSELQHLQDVYGAAVLKELGVSDEVVNELETEIDQSVKTEMKNGFLNVDLPMNYRDLKPEKLVSLLKRGGKPIPKPIPSDMVFVDQKNPNSIRMIWWNVESEEYETQFSSTLTLDGDIEYAKRRCESFRKSYLDRKVSSIESVVGAILPLEHIEGPPNPDEAAIDKIYYQLNVNEVPPTLTFYALDPKTKAVFTFAQNYGKENGFEEALTDWIEDVRHRQLGLYLDQLAHNGFYLGTKKAKEEDFSIKDNQFVKVYTFEPGHLICLAMLDPEKGVQISRITPTDSGYTPGKISRMIGTKQGILERKFRDHLNKFPVVESFTDEGVRKPPYYEIMLEPNGSNIKVHSSIPRLVDGKIEIFEGVDTIPFARLNELDNKLRTVNECAEDLYRAKKEGKIVLCSSDISEQHFKDSQTPIIFGEPNLSKLTLIYKDLINGQEHRRTFNQIDLKRELREMEEHLAFERATGRVPPTISERLTDHLRKFRKEPGDIVPKFEQTLQKTQNYVVSQQPFAAGTPARRLRKGGAERLDATVWRSEEGDFMILPASTRTKRFAKGGFKATSLAVELTKGARPTFFAWSTAIIDSLSDQRVMTQELAVLTKVGEFQEEGARYLLKPRFVSPEYQAAAKGMYYTEKVAKVGIMTEYCDLGEFRYGNVENFHIKDRVAMFKQGLQAAQVLHNRGVVHADVKPGNILVKTNELGKPEVRLADFGLVKELNSPKAHGTTYYLQPHLLAKMRKHPGYDPELKNGPYTDIYAFGLTAFQAVLGKRYPGVDIQNEPNLYKDLLKKSNAGESALEISVEDRSKSKFLRLIYRMAHTDINQIPKKIDEILPVLDEILADEEELRFLEEFTKRA